MPTTSAITQIVHARQAIVCAGLLLTQLVHASANTEEIDFPESEVCIQTANESIPLNAEIASTTEQRKQGLMRRDDLAGDAGMLFVYPEPQPASHGFWMYQTRIPLDVAFLNEDGIIISIQSMEPCQSEFSIGCEVYRSGAEFQGALEVNQGFFAAHGIEPGDRVTQADGSSCAALD